MFRKEVYIPFLLSILLFLSIDISSHNYIALGKVDDSDDNVKDEKEEEKDEKEDEKDEKEEEVPFILPFNAVPFP